MKRLMILVLIAVFTVGTLFTAPQSFADKKDKTNFYGRSSLSSEKRIINGKDTSWFDYENPKDSYKISTEAQLIGLRSLINEEQTDVWKPTRLETFEGVTFTLTKDIELTQPWSPIGLDDSVYFAGTFDGNGHTISGMKIQDPIGASGLFGYLVGEVKNLNVEGVNESNYSNSGGIVGTLSATGRVIDCSSNVKVTGKDKCGGIVGNNEGGYIQGCVNIGNVNGTHKIGGVVGENWGGTVTECGNKGKVKSTRRGVATYGTGGVAGRSVSAEAEVSKCYNMGEINSNTEATGGVVGYINATGSTVSDCYNTGTININIKSSDKEIAPANAGGVVGIAGINGVVVRNCYNTGMINNADIVGGVIGKYLNETEFEISERYIKNNYYVSMSFTSGIGFIEDERDDNLDKAVHGVSAGNMHNLMTSLSVAYMKDTGAYGNNGYPVLRWQEPVSSIEKEYFKDIPEAVQKELDAYLVETADEVPFGQTMINILSPNNTTSNAFILYNEAQDKIKELKKEEARKNEQQKHK